MKIRLIYNPNAGSGGVTERDIVSALERAGHKVTEQRPDVVIAAGGDGTVIATAQELDGSDTPLIALPLGTANNIARSFGMNRDLDALVKMLQQPRVRRMDKGIAYGAWGERVFIEGGGVGLFCDAIDESQKDVPIIGEEDKHPRRAAKRLREVLATYDARRFDVAIDGLDTSDRYLLLDVMNMPMLGPNLCLSPEADPFDGKLDVTLVRERDRGALIGYLDALANGNAVCPPKFDVRKASHIRIRLHDSCLRLDDEFRSDCHSRSPFADLRVVPGAVLVWLPEEPRVLEAEPLPLEDQPIAATG